MTENKRFTFGAVGPNIAMISDNDQPLNVREIVELLNALHEENQSLKQGINEVKELLLEEVDVFSDKATEHDINAYIELKELDNKDAYYIATATKKSIKILKELSEWLNG